MKRGEGQSRRAEQRWDETKLGDTQVPPAPSGFPARARCVQFTLLPLPKTTRRSSAGGPRGEGSRVTSSPPSRQPATLLPFYTCAPRPETDGARSPRAVKELPLAQAVGAESARPPGSTRTRLPPVRGGGGECVGCGGVVEIEAAGGLVSDLSWGCGG